MTQSTDNGSVTETETPVYVSSKHNQTQPHNCNEILLKRFPVQMKIHPNFTYALKVSGIDKSLMHTV